MQFFLVIFLGWVMLPHPQATSTDHGGPRTSDLSIERRRRNHFTTAPRTNNRTNRPKQNNRPKPQTKLSLETTLKTDELLKQNSVKQK